MKPYWYLQTVGLQKRWCSNYKKKMIYINWVYTFLKVGQKQSEHLQKKA